MTRQTYLNDGENRREITIGPERTIQNHSSKSLSTNPEHTRTYTNIRTTGKHVVICRRYSTCHTYNSHIIRAYSLHRWALAYTHRYKSERATDSDVDKNNSHGEHLKKRRMFIMGNINQ